jgi:hypothetical protein
VEQKTVAGFHVPAAIHPDLASFTYPIWI